MDEENSYEGEQNPEPTEAGSPIPDPEATDTNAEDIPQAD